MRRAIVVQSDYRFMSALVGKDTAETLKVGDPVRVTKDLHVDHLGKVAKGETAKIVFTDKDSGAVEIEFDRVLPNLNEWRNCILLAPYDSDDLLAGLALNTVLEAKEHRPSRVRPRHWVPLAAVALIATFVLGMVVGDSENVNRKIEALGSHFTHTNASYHADDTDDDAAFPCGKG